MQTVLCNQKSLPSSREGSNPEGDADVSHRDPTDEQSTLSDSVHPAKGWDSEEGVIWADDQGYIIYANPASERFLGLPPVELCGVFGFALCQPHSLPTAREAFNRCVEHPDLPVEAVVDIVRPSLGFRTLKVTLLNQLSVPDIKAIVVHFRDAAPPVPRMYDGSVRP